MIVPGYTNPQNLNRYGYVSNNPLRYIDPTGHMMDDGLDGGGLPPNIPGGGCSGSNCQGSSGGGSNGGSGGGNNGGGDGSEGEGNSSGGSGNGGYYDDEDDNEYFCFTHPSSCDININPDAIVDPLAWSHIAEGILGGVVLFGVGDLLIGAGAFVCTSVVGCIAGVPVILAGVLAYPVGVGFIYYGVEAGEIYLDEIIEVSILSED